VTVDPIPLPGDPTALDAAARRQLLVADAIDTAVRDLQDLAGGEIADSDAVDALSAQASTVASTIQRASVRLRETAEAAVEFAASLDTLQGDADAAILAHDQARLEQDRALVHVRQLEQDPSADPASLERWRDRVTQHGQEILNADAQWNRVHEQWNEAAQRAIARINDAADVSGLDDGLFDWIAEGWEGFMQWVRDNADLLATIGDILSVISEWAGYLAGIFSLLALIPGLGVVFGPLATLAEVVTLVTAGLSLLLTLVLVLAGTGKRTIGDLIGQALGFAVGFIPVPGLKGVTESVTRTVAQESGRAAGRITGTIVKFVVEETVHAGEGYVADVIGATTDAVVNTTNPNLAATCPADPPPPLIFPPVDWILHPDGPPPIVTPLVPVAINPEYIATIGCRP